MSQRARANLLGPTIPSPILGEGQSVLARLSQTTLGSEPLSTPMQIQMDGMVSHFAQEASDWQALASMAAGEMAFRWGRIGALALGEGYLSALPLRFLSYGVGLGPRFRL
jgi:hypothetical protein